MNALRNTSLSFNAQAIIQEVTIWQNVPGNEVYFILIGILVITGKQ